MCDICLFACCHRQLMTSLEMTSIVTIVTNICTLSVVVMNIVAMVTIVDTVIANSVHLLFSVLLILCFHLLLPLLNLHIFSKESTGVPYLWHITQNCNSVLMLLVLLWLGYWNHVYAAAKDSELRTMSLRTMHEEMLVSGESSITLLFLMSSSGSRSMRN